MSNKEHITSVERIYHDAVDTFTHFSWSQILGLAGIVLTPLIPVVIGLTFLVLADMVLGIWASIRRHGWRNISSRRMSDSVTKFLVYFVVVCATFGTNILLYYVADLGGGGAMLLDYFPMVSVVTGVIIFTELRSLYENASTILGYDLWTRIKAAMVESRLKGLREVKDHKKDD